MASRQLKFFQAIREGIDLCLAHDPVVYLMGLGVPDPKGVFGTTLGLQQEYGSTRVMDMPTSENAMTGVAIGSALAGMRPILAHQRVDFALLSIDQIVNQAAKWHYMFGGKMKIPLVIRMIIGRGWGQGPQHSQSLQAWFAHVPGLKVVMPSTPYNAKGLLIASVEDNNPVIFIESRWLYNIEGLVPEGLYRVPLGSAHIARTGTDLTVVATSYMVVEALRAAERLAQSGVQVEVVDVQTLKPLDRELILRSVQKTGRLIVADTGWVTGGFGAELIALASEEAFESLKCPPRRVGLPDCPVPSTPGLSRYCYPGAAELIATAGELLGISTSDLLVPEEASLPSDVPYASFTGPF